MRRPLMAAAIALAVVASACDDAPPTASPTPAPPTPPPGFRPEAVPGEGSGPTEIALLSSEPRVGTSLSGCGSGVSGCSGRIQMRFRLESAEGGPVLDAVGFLHATNLLACLSGSTGPFDLAPGTPREVVISFDRADDDACSSPASLTHLKVVVSGPVELASAQEWATTYELLP